MTSLVLRSFFGYLKAEGQKLLHTLFSDSDWRRNKPKARDITLKW